MSDININTAEVCKLLKAINPHKACEPDQIPDIILKNPSTPGHLPTIVGHIYRLLMTYLEEHIILTYLNHGFRAAFLCETQLLITMHILFSTLPLDTGTQTDKAVLDFSKTFDTVPPNQLLRLKCICKSCSQYVNSSRSFCTSCESD